MRRSLLLERRKVYSKNRCTIKKKCNFEKKILEKKPEVLLPVLVQKKYDRNSKNKKYSQRML